MEITPHYFIIISPPGPVLDQAGYILAPGKGGGVPHINVSATPHIRGLALIKIGLELMPPNPWPRLRLAFIKSQL